MAKSSGLYRTYVDFSDDVDKAIAAHNQGEHAVDVAASKDGQWQNNLKPEGQRYMGRAVSIKIENGTGGSAVVGAAQGAP